MSEIKHTPGPWEAEEFCEGGNVAFVRIGNITVDGSYRGGESDALSLADARLIAAAPDLLAALKKVMESSQESPPDTVQGWEDILEKTRNAGAFARAAIAKALGS